MKYVLALFALLLAGAACATSVPLKPLEEMVGEADHVVVATVESVDMVGGRGEPIIDPKARTGPGSKNRMRFNLRVEELLFTRSPVLPPALRVPLWSAWHYELGDIQEQVTGSTGIFLLKGDDYQPVYPADFQRPLDEREQIERLLQSR
ncbi:MULTISPECIES: hypothetical protein [Lysobacter]|uniref:hypothetical protein n=1 Tax=Lysobacter TaxID=68 RepID=UPI0004D003E9|nr:MULTISPECIES: hypothetical protein [Lysobacter]